MPGRRWSGEEKANKYIRGIKTNMGTLPKQKLRYWMP
jgi:hypothetical protein